MLVQGEHQTRQYDKTIQIPNGKKKSEQVIKATAVELKADTIKLLDRASNASAYSGEGERNSGRKSNGIPAGR